MTPEEREYVRYRMERAQQTLRAASILLENGHLPDAVNRLYYACFYGVSALLATEGFSSGKHSGVRGLFDRHWVNTGRIPIERGRFYRALFKRRHQGDYQDLVGFEAEDVAAWLRQADEFVADLLREVERKVDSEETLG